MTERFVLNDLPDNCWAVSWPGYEDVVVDTPGKALNLLKILFDDVGVTEAMIGVSHKTRSNNETMYVSQLLWLEERSRDYIARDLIRYNVYGVKFRDQYEAEKFKLCMEQRLVWRRLSDRSWE